MGARQERRVRIRGSAAMESPNEMPIFKMFRRKSLKVVDSPNQAVGYKIEETSWFYNDSERLALLPEDTDTFKA